MKKFMVFICGKEEPVDGSADRYSVDEQKKNLNLRKNNYQIYDWSHSMKPFKVVGTILGFVLVLTIIVLSLAYLFVGF